MSSRYSYRYGFAIALGMVLVGHNAAQAQFGVVLSGAGPENRSMGGASTAAPLDAAGALYWNPATITGLHGSELGFGLEALYPETRLSSSFPANSFSRGVPPVPLAGSTHSDGGVFLLPTIGLVYQPEESPLAFGLGLFSAGGFGINYAASTTNPILTPQPPHGLGLGALYTNFEVLQLVPTAAWRLTDRLSIGIAPTLSVATLTADPFFLASPVEVGGFPNYLAGTHGRFRAGAGFQAGVYYTTENDWNFGASIKSPQWFENFRYSTVDGLGRPQHVQVHLDYPLMASLGTSYTGFEHWTFAADVRYIDYADTPGFDGTGFDATGALRGLGWDSVFAVALGAQYELTPATALRAGYSYNTNPIRDDRTSFNVASPLIMENTIYLGATYKCTPTFRVSVAYVHVFENSTSGPLVTPLGAVPGTSVESTVSADAILIGATLKY